MAAAIAVSDIIISFFLLKRSAHTPAKKDIKNAGSMLHIIEIVIIAPDCVCSNIYQLMAYCTKAVPNNDTVCPYINITVFLFSYCPYKSFFAVLKNNGGNCLLWHSLYAIKCHGVLIQYLSPLLIGKLYIHKPLHFVFMTPHRKISSEHKPLRAQFFNNFKRAVGF